MTAQASPNPAAVRDVIAERRPPADRVLAVLPASDLVTAAAEAVAPVPQPQRGLLPAASYQDSAAPSGMPRKSVTMALPSTHGQAVGCRRAMLRNELGRRGGAVLAWSRWLVAVVLSLACFGACWAGLALARLGDTRVQVGVASAPLVVILAAQGVRRSGRVRLGVLRCSGNQRPSSSVHL
jgi:hypothetical protein